MESFDDDSDEHDRAGWLDRATAWVLVLGAMVFLVFLGLVIYEIAHGLRGPTDL